VNGTGKTDAISVFRGGAAIAPCYRAFLLDIENRVFAVRLLITKEHTTALRLAQRIQAPCDMIEVWYGTTKLGVVVPRNKMG
jgi:hypothetical protein